MKLSIRSIGIFFLVFLFFITFFASAQYRMPVCGTYAQFYKGDSISVTTFGASTVQGVYAIQDIRFYILQNNQITVYPLPEEDIMELYEYYSDTYKDHFYTTEKGTYENYYFEKVVS